MARVGIRKWDAIKLMKVLMQLKCTDPSDGLTVDRGEDYDDITVVLCIGSGGCSYSGTMDEICKEILKTERLCEEVKDA